MRGSTKRTLAGPVVISTEFPTSCWVRQSLRMFRPNSFQANLGFDQIGAALYAKDPATDHRVEGSYGNRSAGGAATSLKGVTRPIRGPSAVSARTPARPHALGISGCR